MGINKDNANKEQIARDLIRSWAKAFCRDEGIDFTAFLPSRQVSANEARGLFRALDHGLLKVDERGYFTLPSLKKPGLTKQFIKKSQSKAILSIEWFTHVAIIDELISDYGWPPSLVDFETLPFDAVAYLPDDLRSPVIVTEAKKDLKQLDDLTKIIAEGVEGRVHIDNPKHTKNDYRKYWGLLGKWLSMESENLVIKHMTPPRWLLIAAPGKRICYSVKLSKNILKLTQVSKLPTYREAQSAH